PEDQSVARYTPHRDRVEAKGPSRHNRRRSARRPKPDPSRDLLPETRPSRNLKDSPSDRSDTSPSRTPHTRSMSSRHPCKPSNHPRTDANFGRLLRCRAASRTHNLRHQSSCHRKDYRKNNRRKFPVLSPAEEQTRPESV